jgi:hypothetical protein
VDKFKVGIPLSFIIYSIILVVRRPVTGVPPTEERDLNVAMSQV